MGAVETSEGRHRLDVWLWHARVASTRTACASLVKAGRVRLNGARILAPGHAVRLGDAVTIALDGRVRILEVAGFSERRGDAKAAAAIST
ncbi:S4 domain-containing protein [Ancylobacter sp. G4_0304]|uniref:S4 domain-containing protein n=1 Tax=Ancylobacter sp. G4_0304 TaxID=3114289 RepID=UPI0039C5F9F9